MFTTKERVKKFNYPRLLRTTTTGVLLNVVLIQPLHTLIPCHCVWVKVRETKRMSGERKCERESDTERQSERERTKEYTTEQNNVWHGMSLFTYCKSLMVISIIWLFITQTLTCV